MEPPGVRRQVRVRPQRQGDRLLLAGEGVTRGVSGDAAGVPGPAGGRTATRSHNAKPTRRGWALSLDLVPSAGYSLRIPASHPLSLPPGGARMIRLLGSPRRCCDGLTRRETLDRRGPHPPRRGFTLPQLLAAEARKPADARPGKAKNVIVLYLLGGAATQDMFDLKPERPGRGPRRVQADRHQRARRPGLRTPAAHGEVDAQGRRRPLGQPQGRLPQLPAQLHRLRAARCPTSTRATATRRAWGRSASTCAQGRGELAGLRLHAC